MNQSKKDQNQKEHDQQSQTEALTIEAGGCTIDTKSTKIHGIVHSSFSFGF
jgi:hypothetical protein